MDNQHGEILSLSTEGTGVNLQVLKGQVNYLQWWRDFQVVAQAKGFFDIFIGRESIYAPPNASDFGFDEVEEVGDVEDVQNVNQTEGPTGPIIVDGKIIRQDQTPAVEKTKKTRKARFSLTPHELSTIRDEATSSQAKDDDQERSAKETASSSHKKLDVSSRLALYKFNLDAYEKSHKRVHQAMALLVYWVDPVIRGRLQSYVEPFAAVKYLESQYKMSEVRLQESAANNFEHVHLSKSRGVQDFLNKIENARQDILDSGGMCTENMIISKIMRSLTPPFNPFVDHYHFFRDNDPSTLDLSQMTARLLTFESDLDQRKNAKALVTIAPAKPRNELKCDTCNKKGHTKDRCWQTYPHLKKSPQELQAAREKPRNGPTKAETPRKVLAVAKTNLELFNQNLLDKKCNVCDRKGHLKYDCWLAYPGQNKSGRPLNAGTRRPHRRCKTLSSETTNTDIDSTTQNREESFVVANKIKEGGYIGGCGNTGLECGSGVQGAILRSSHSLPRGKGANSWSRDDFVPHSLNPTCMMLLGMDSTDVEQDKWILDSGANVHAVNDMKWFNSFHEFDMKVATADDVNTIDILGGGTVEVSTITDENELITLELSKVAYSPGLRCNILSLSLLGKVGNLKGCWSTDKIEIVTQNNNPVCSAIEQEGLYVLNFAKYGKHTSNREQPHQLPTKSQISVPGGVKPPCIVATIDFREKVWKWHRRLGHLGLENLRRLLKVSEGMDITDKDIRNKLGAVCPVCATSRALYTIPRDPATRRYRNAGDLIHVDGWGPYAMVGIGGIRGFVALTDEATRFVWTKPYKKKEEVVSIFLDMLKMIGRTYNIEIRRVRMDNEFNTNQTEAYFEEKGITMEPSVPYAHHQNGVAERNFRTERERTAAMIQENILPQRIRNIVLGSADELLKSSTAPEKLWPEAWKHATWIKIRSPTRALKSRKTPWELLTQHVPDLSRERVWGSRTYVTIPPEKRGPKLHVARGWMGYFMGCESESIYRIWNPDKNKVVRVSAARVDDGEGLDDPQDGPNRNNRNSTHTSPERIEDVVESESEESGSDKSESQHSLVQDVPGAQREDVFMSGAIQSDSDSQDNQNNSTPPPALDTGNENHPIDTDNEVAQETNLQDQNPPENSESHTSASDSSSEGEVSPFFQRQNQPTVQMAKRKYSSKDEDDDKTPKRTAQPKHEKCANCAKHEAKCDGTLPFLNKCSSCTKNKRKCYPQGVDPESVPEKRTPNNKTPKRTAQPIHEKCANCAKQETKCDGTLPFLNKCSSCIKYNRKCYPQGVDPDSVPKIWTPNNIPQPAQEKCGPCQKKRRKCDGIYPFLKKCTSCIKDRAVCYPQGNKPKKVTTEEKCGCCKFRNRTCNGQMPCNTCKNDKKVCTYAENDEIWTWQPDQEKWKVASEEKCYECMTRSQKFFGGSPDTCNGKFPCNCCTAQTFGGVRYRCTYHLENGIKKQYRLSHEKIQKAQITHQKKHEKYRSQNKKNLRNKTAAKSDSEDDTDDLDEDLFDKLHSDDDSDQGGHDSNQMGRFGDQNQPHEDSNDEDHQNGSDNQDQEKGTDQDHSHEDSNPDNAEEWGAFESSFQENLSDETSHRDDGDYGDDAGYRLGDKIDDPSLKSPDSDQWGDFEHPPNISNNPNVEKEEEVSQYFTDDGDQHSEEEVENEKSTLLNPKSQVYSFRQEPANFCQMRKALGYTCSSDIENSKRFDNDSDKENIDPVTTKQLTPSRDCVICQAEMALDPEPRNRREALQKPDATKWANAMQDEYNSLLKNKTWEVVDCPKNQHVISSRWVLRRKLGADGSVAKYKARFVGRGFEQIHGVDFDETFASVVKQPSYRILFALQAMLGWKCHQMDVKTAFLHGDVDEVIYIRPPDGFPESNGQVLRLRKALYGLKQSPRLWYLRLKKFLTSKGWKASSFDTSVFMHPSGMFLTVYVDDINIFGEFENNIIKFKKELATEFEMTDLGECAYYLGLHVHMRPEGTYLHQASFIQQILNRFSLNDIKAVSTPTNLANKITANKDEIATQDFTRLYQAMVGSVIYLATVSRPDISFATSRVSRYMSNPSENHMKEVHRLYAYLKGSMNLGLMFATQSKDNINGMVDSDWGNCPDTTRSTGGWIFNLGGSPVSWSSKRQATVALSSCEAEYMAASEATKEAIWIRNLVQEFQLPMFKNLTIPIAIDNNSAMKLSKNPEFHARTKHIAMRHHFIREKVAQGEVQVHRVDTKNNLADLLTKGLPRPRLQELIQKMGMRIMPQ